MLAFPVAKLENVRMQYQGASRPRNLRPQSSPLDGRLFCYNVRNGYLLPSGVTGQPGSPVPISAPFLSGFHNGVVPPLSGSDRQTEFAVTYRKHRTAYRSNRGRNAPYDSRARTHFSILSSTPSPVIEPGEILRLVHSRQGPR